MNFRKLLVVLGIVIFSLGMLGVSIKNRDRGRVFLERLGPSTYVTTDLPQLLYANSLFEKPSWLQFDQEEEGEESKKFECLNGKDPATLGKKEQLLEFIKGPCLPVVVVPGLLASKLSVKIDCEVFQANNPEIFSACGWQSCSWWKIWEPKPQGEYKLWISSFLGPLSFAFENSATCWGNIIQLDYNENEVDLKKKYSSPKGVEVEVYREDSEKSQCGFEAITDLFPLPFQTKYSKGWKGTKEKLVGMGYQIGLTLYSTPYDWRRTTMSNGVSEVIHQTIHQSYKLTGKPAIIVAHSLGNFGTLNFLNSLSKEEKEKYVANYVSLANPLAGSPKALKAFIGGEKEYVYKRFGINYYAQRMLLKSNSGAFDVLPKDIYRYFADSPWLQEWKVRAQLEHDHDVRTPEGRAAWDSLIKSNDYPYSWFPHPLINCSFGFEQRRDECGLYMYNWSSIPLARINGQSFNASEHELRELFDKYVLMTNVSDGLFEDVRTNHIYMLSNPEVPVTLIYGSHLSTDMTYEWDYDPRIRTRQDDFAFPTKTMYSQGDRTVPTSSALLPALKWAWEFDNKEKSGVLNAKPVKTVEICSTHNNKQHIYDEKDPDRPFQTKENEYIGLECGCFGKDTSHLVLGQSCDHADILNDSKFIEFLAGIVVANHRISNPEEVVNKVSDEDLNTLSQNCPHVNSKSLVFSNILSSSNCEY